MTETKKSQSSFYSDIGKLEFSPLVYPSDLNRDNFYPDCVCFTIQKRTGVSITDVTASVASIASTAEEGWHGADSKQLEHHPDLRKLIKKAYKENKVDGDDEAAIIKQKKYLLKYHQIILRVKSFLKICWS